MNKYLLLLSVIILGFSSCKKSADNTVSIQAAADDAAIQAYIKTNSITATKDASGLYYSIITPGSGAYPIATSNVSVSYTGSLLDGTVFETGPSSAFYLPAVIQGWQIGIQKINKGGTILLLVPSALGYGATANGSIPANSVLVFKIGLQGFN